MQDEFTDVGGVITRIAADLLARFPSAEAEAFLDERGPFRPRPVRGTLVAVLPIFSEFCARLPRAWVAYVPDHPYGMVAKVVGHCHCPSGDCQTQCRRYDERPHAILTLTQIGGRQVPLGRFVKAGAGAPRAAAKKPGPDSSDFMI